MCEQSYLLIGGSIPLMVESVPRMGYAVDNNALGFLTAQYRRAVIRLLIIPKATFLLRVGGYRA